MSSEEDDGGISFAVPGEVDDWLAREGERREESRDDVCQRLVTAAHAVAADDGLEPADLEGVTALQGQLDAQREEFIDLLEDVRGRVIQVKRETDGKAPADHEHGEYARDDDRRTLRADLDALESTVDDGFENFEDILERLFEETAALEDRSALLANAVLDLREQRDALAERERRRAAADHLKRAANRLGVRAAVCDGCDGRVEIALLTEPECPHCASAFADVSENTSFFGSHALVTGDPPALEGRVEPAVASTSDAVFDAVEADAARESTTADGDGNDTGDGGSSRGPDPVPGFETGGSRR